MTETNQTLTEAVEVSLADAGDMLGARDQAAAQLLRSLAGAFDAVVVENPEAAVALAARITAIMVELRLTPKSRDAAPVETKGTASNGKEFSEAYLRLITAPVGNPTPKRTKPRAGSSGTS